MFGGLERVLSEFFLEFFAGYLIVHCGGMFISNLVIEIIVFFCQGVLVILNQFEQNILILLEHVDFNLVLLILR